MAIDQRQVNDLKSLIPKFSVANIMMGEEANVNISYDEEENEYRMYFTFPEAIMAPPEDLDKEDPEPEPSDPSTSEPEPVDLPEKKSLNQFELDELQDIVTVVRAGEAPNYWAIGDYINIKVGSFTMSGLTTDLNYQGNRYIKAVIIDFDHNVEKEHGAGKHSMTLCLLKNQNDGIMSFGTHYVPVTKWVSKWYGAMYNCLPSEWQAVIAKTKKYDTSMVQVANETSSGTHLEKQTVAKNYRIFPMSYYEYNGPSSDFSSDGFFANEKNNQTQYEYFKSSSHKIGSHWWFSNDKTPAVGSAKGTNAAWVLLSRTKGLYASSGDWIVMNMSTRGTTLRTRPWVLETGDVTGFAGYMDYKAIRLDSSSVSVSKIGWGENANGKKGINYITSVPDPGTLKTAERLGLAAWPTTLYQKLAYTFPIAHVIPCFDIA